MRGLVLEQWLGLFVAAGTAPEISTRLAAEVSKALAVPAVRERFAQLGLEPRTSSGSTGRTMRSTGGD